MEIQDAMDSKALNIPSDVRYRFTELAWRFLIAFQRLPRREDQRTPHYSYDCTPCGSWAILGGSDGHSAVSCQIVMALNLLSWAKMEQELPASPSLWSRALSLIQFSNGKVLEHSGLRE